MQKTIKKPIGRLISDGNETYLANNIEAMNTHPTPYNISMLVMSFE